MTENSPSGLWAKTKALTKGGIILALLLIFLIPAHQIRELILEREQQLQEVEKEVKSKWASDQQITGPVLVIPYLEKYPAASLRRIWRLHSYYWPRPGGKLSHAQPFSSLQSSPAR